MQFTQLKTEAEVNDLIAFHNQHSSYVVIDTETSGLNPHVDRLLSIVASGRNPDDACAFDAKWATSLKGLTTQTLVFHNFKFDLNFLFRAGVDLRIGHDIQDSMLMHHLIDENASHKLDDIVKETYGDNYKELFWSLYKRFEDAPEQAALEYSCKDVIYTGMCYLRMVSGGLDHALSNHVHKLALALYDTELRGLAVDLSYCSEIGAYLNPKIAEYKVEMRKAAEAACLAVEYDRWALATDKSWTPKGKKWYTLPKPDFNWNSHQQVNSLLFDKLKLPEQLKKNDKGEMVRTSDDDALARVELLHPVVPMLRQHAGYQKVYGSFIEGTLERVQNGRIYPEFNVNGTVTGRISSSNPNMQQLPAGGDWAKVRGVYIPDPECSIISCDYGQLEVVIAAHFSQDPNLLKIVLEGASKHDITSTALGIERPLAKTLNFAMQYQCSPRKVAQILGCSPKEATYIWNKYWETYAGEKRVIDECKLLVDQGKPIVSPWGRKRHFPKEFAQSWHRDAAYRQAYSSLIQGTGADCTHNAFYSTAETLSKKGLGRALFEVHDEIVINAVNKHCEEATDVLQSSMVAAGKVINLTVPLTTDCSEPLERWTK